MSRFVIFGVLALVALVWLGVMTLNGNPSPQEKASAGKAASPPHPSSSKALQDSQGVGAEVAVVESRILDRTIQLPGELRPFLSVNINPKVTGIVGWIEVDRGSFVKKGDLLVRLSAPELRSQRIEAEAQLKGAEITYSRLKAAASTPGVVAGNELELAEHHKEAAAARAQSLQEMENYLNVSAPFDGVIVQRNVHPGAVVGPAGGAGGHTPLLQLEQVDRLRLVVAVPEVYSGSIAQGAEVLFTVPAYPEEEFKGVISRVSRSIDQKTRTMPVEMDVPNPEGKLASGMFPDVRWPVRRPAPTLFVPLTAIATTTEQTFVVRVRNDEAEWVPVKKGAVSGDRIEVFGALQPGDSILLRGTDEIRPGTRVQPLHPQKGV